MYLFFDTETTGVPKNYKAPVTDIANWPRMVQIAWLLYNDQQQAVARQEYIIRPEGFTIPEEAAKIHGISTQKALEEGVSLQMVLEEFKDYISESKAIIAHNISFDEKIVGAEFVRKNISHALFAKPRICTMHGSTNFCQLPGRYGFKWPKLSELHIKLFGEDFEGAHDALADIEATARCYWELKRIGVM